MSQGLSKGDKAAWNTPGARPGSKVMDRLVQDASTRGRRAAKKRKPAAAAAETPERGASGRSTKRGASRR